MFKVKPTLRAIALCVHANAGRRMPLAQAHPFQPMPVTHEEADLQEVSLAMCGYGWLGVDWRSRSNESMLPVVLHVYAMSQSQLD